MYLAETVCRNKTLYMELHKEPRTRQYKAHFTLDTKLMRKEKFVITAFIFIPNTTTKQQQ